MISLLAAFQFLTLIPALVRRPFTGRELGAAVVYYPLVGLALGALLAGLYWLLGLLFPPAVTAGLLVALWVLFTGALHLDGLMDAFDGLLGGGTPESRLKIMRDERIGAFGMVAGFLLLLLKYSSLLSGGFTPLALLAAPMLGRWAITLVLVSFPYGRQQGLGRVIKDSAKPLHLLLATAFTAVVCWLLFGLAGLALLLLAGATAWACAVYTLRRIPGLTGDIYGATGELVELVTLLACTTGLVTA